MGCRVLLIFALLGTPIASRADSQTCASCHADIFRKYQQSEMSRSFSRLRPENTIEDFAGKNHYYHAASDTHYEMLARDGKYYQRRYQTGYDGKAANVEEKQIDYVMGSGNHARTYLHVAANGDLVQLPLGWYAEAGGFWAMSPGYDTADHPGARRAIGYDCMFCHNAYPKIPERQDRFSQRAIYTGALPEGIDCQRCHGPGEAHAKTGSAILNPARLSDERRMEVCMQCHLESNSFRLPHAVKRYDRGFFEYNPSEPLSRLMLFFDTKDRGAADDRFQIVNSVYRLRQSACFLKSGGALRCTTCHDPHASGHSVKATEYDNACRSCHAETFRQSVAAGRHTSEDNCVGCHMPRRRTEDVVHVVMTDHYIRRTPPRDQLGALPEKHETDATAYHGEVMLDPPGKQQPSAGDALYVALAQVRDKSNLAAGIPQLQKILEGTRPGRAEPYFELAEALRAAGRLPEAVAQYEQAARKDPKYLPAILQWGTALKEAGRNDEATAVFQRGTEAAPGDARPWNELGQLQMDAGSLREAVEALSKAAVLDAEMPEPRNGLGIILAQSGEGERAELAFRDAIRMSPNYGDAHGNLANLLAWKGDAGQAEYEFQKALRLQPGDALVRFNYGSMLNRQGKFAEAQTQMEEAVRANQNFAEAHDLLGNLWERQGQLEEALKEYRAAVKAQPKLDRAQLDLGASLGRLGDRTNAAVHLQLAAQSGDEVIRTMALRLLGELGVGK